MTRIDYDNKSCSWSVEAETSLYGYGDLVKAIKLTPQYLLTLTNKVSNTILFLTLNNKICRWLLLERGIMCLLLLSVSLMAMLCWRPIE